MPKAKTTSELLDGFREPHTAMVKADPMEAKRLTKAVKQEIAGLAKYLIEDPLYLLDLKARLLSGRLHPTLETMLFAYAYGKPKERIEVRKASIVKIIHEFSSAPRLVQGDVIDGDQGNSAQVESAAEQGDAVYDPFSRRRGGDSFGQDDGGGVESDPAGV